VDIVTEFKFLLNHDNYRDISLSNNGNITELKSTLKNQEVEEEKMGECQEATGLVKN
jgi:hypothetical protein